jgi:hypothetical protein
MDVLFLLDGDVAWCSEYREAEPVVRPFSLGRGYAISLYP